MLADIYSLCHTTVLYYVGKILEFFSKLPNQIFIFKTAWKLYFKNNEKIPGNFLKNLEKSWNFVSPEKWERFALEEYFGGECT